MAGRNWPSPMTSNSVLPRINRMRWPLLERAFHDADVNDDALVGVEVAVVNQGLAGRPDRPAAPERGR